MIARALAILLAASPAVAGYGPSPAAVAPLGAPSSSLAPDLGDPILKDLLIRAELGSIDLRLALARLERAGADVDLERAGRRAHLTVGLEAASGGARFSSMSAGAGTPVLGSYEVDLFGRLKHGQDAAVAEEAASLQDAVGVRRLLQAQVAHAYVTLRAAQARRAAAQARAASAGKVSEMIARRKLEGGATEAQVAAAQAAQAQLGADAQQAGHAIEAQRLRLGILLGLDEPVDEPVFAGGDIAPTPAVSAVASEAVLGRADVLAAQARLQAADARRAEAVAASRPRFMLTAGLGSGDTDLLYLLDVRALAWAVAGGLTHQLFDGGAAKARKRGAQAETQIAELAYRKTVGEAWGQARLNLAALQDAATAESLARQARGQALLAFEGGRTRHDHGDIDGLDLAALENQALEAQTALADAQAARALAYVDLSVALGGRTS